MADALDGILEEARSLGFLGPGPVAEQRLHAEAFLGALGEWESGDAIDLGSGGGVPGLVLAVQLPGTRWVLLDAMQRRTSFLDAAVDTLGLRERVRVVSARAEDAGRSPELREQFDVLVSRGFGPPPVTAECAAPFVRNGGMVIVSEPPGSTGARWPAEGLADAGLRVEEVLAGPPAMVRLRRHGPAPDRLPRRVGVPGKRPLW